MKNTRRTSSTPARALLGVGFVLGAVGLVYGLILPREEPLPAPASPVPASPITPARSVHPQALNDAYLRGRAVLQRELDDTDQLWSWVLGVRALGKDTNSQGRALLGLIAENLTRSTPSSNDQPPLKLTELTPPPSAGAAQQGVYAVLLQANPAQQQLLGEDQQPLTADDLLASVIATSPRLDVGSAQEISWHMDALGMGLLRSSSPRLTDYARQDLAQVTDWVAQQLERRGAVLNSYKGGTTRSDLADSRARREGLFFFDDAGVALTIACFRASAVLGESDQLKRAQHLWGRTLQRHALERELFLGDPAPNLAGLRYFAGIVEALILGREALATDSAQRPSDTYRSAVHLAASDLLTVFGQLETAGAFASLSALRQRDPAQYLLTLEAISYAVLSLRIAAQMPP